MTCPLFVELCAGTAAVSLRLARARARPPVSRMGAKTGYADAILGLAGLAPGQGAGHYLWCEPDPGCRLLLEAYRDAALARAAADIIRGWAGEDPRALWERLRAEGPPRGPEVSPGGLPFAQEVARAVIIGQWAYRRGSPESGFAEARTGGGSGEGHGDTADMLAARWAIAPVMPQATIAPDARAIDPYEVARFAQIVASNRLINTAWSDAEGRWVNTGDGGATFGGAEFCSPPERTAEGLDAAPSGLPAVLAPDAREVDPREVARWVTVGQLSYRQMEPASGFNPGMARDSASPCWRHGLADVAGALSEVGQRSATILPDAHAADPGPALPPGTVVLFDPPYQGTTPYAHDLPRADVVALARRWAAAGALVMVCEAEPIPELLADGWVYRDIAHARKGQSRTFSRQQREVVTMSRPPVHVPAEQVGLFGGAP